MFLYISPKTETPVNFQVAHRIRSIIDYDRLIVLDKGRVSDGTVLYACTQWCILFLLEQVVEFDTPYNLIQKKDGVFRNMCLHTGHFDDLHAIAARGVKND
jgi:hypothetical protein